MPGADVADESAGVDQDGEQVADLRLEHRAAHHQAAQEHRGDGDQQQQAPRPVRFSRKWPPPGISQPSATAGAQTPIGGSGLLLFFFLAMFLLSLAGDRGPYRTRRTYRGSRIVPQITW